MELDDLKNAWVAHGAKLERSVALQEWIVRDALVGKTRRALAPFSRGRAVEVVAGLAMLVAVMPVLVAHSGELRYLVVGGGVAVLLVALTAAWTYLLVTSLTIDYGAPVTAIQRAVERLRMAECRTLKWAVLGGVVAWLPAALMIAEALTGVEALARVDGGWLLANLAFGLVVLWIGLFLSRRYVERPDLNPRAQRLADALSGRAVRRAAARLAELARFEREDA